MLWEAQRASIQSDILLRAGLIVSRKDGDGYYDRFRGRLMFPILNPSGRVVGFGGRTLQSEEGPKYLNSPETPVYQKSLILYGLFQSKEGIREENCALIVEGYTDLMRLYQCGLHHGVATSGTALTDGQVKLLYRYTQNVILIFDGDSAGFDAALRGVDVLVGAGLHVKIALLPKGEDPDSFLRKHNRQKLDMILNSANTIVDFKLDQILRSVDSKTPAEKASAARSVLATISKIKEPVERNLMIKEITEKLGVDESLLIHELKRNSVRSGNRDDQNQTRLAPARDRTEEGILRLLVEDPEKWGRSIFQFVRPEYFTTKEIRLLVEKLYESFKHGKILNSSNLMDEFADNPTIVQCLTRVLAEGFGDQVNRSQFGLDCLLNLHQREIRKKMRKLREEMRSAQKKNEDVTEYSKRWIDLNKTLEKLRVELTFEWKKKVEF
jgi:DNA primase